MTAASVSSPQIVSLLIVNDDGIQEVKATVAYTVQVDGMTVEAKKEVDAWGVYNNGQKNQFRNLMDAILESL